MQRQRHKNQRVESRDYYKTDVLCYVNVFLATETETLARLSVAHVINGLVVVESGS